MTKTTAAAVSAALRRTGFNPVGSGNTREGLRVKGSGVQVYVVADLDSDRAAARMAQDARDALAEAGYVVAELAEGKASFYVTGKNEK